MNHDGELPALDLERFRHYLQVLARQQLPLRLQHKFDSSDLVQQTLLEAHRNRGQFRGQTTGELAAWLRQMLAADIADALRGQSRARRDVAREQSLEAELGKSSAQLEGWLAAGDSSPSQRAVRNEELLQLADALAGLPEDQRMAVELKHLRGQSLAAIALVMDRTEKSVCGLLRRGMIRLRELLPERG